MMGHCITEREGVYFTSLNLQCHRNTWWKTLTPTVDSAVADCGSVMKAKVSSQHYMRHWHKSHPHSIQETTYAYHASWFSGRSVMNLIWHWISGLMLRINYDTRHETKKTLGKLLALPFMSLIISAALFIDMLSLCWNTSQPFAAIYARYVLLQHLLL